MGDRGSKHSTQSRAQNRAMWHCVCCAQPLADELGPVQCAICSRPFCRACLGVPRHSLLGGSLSRCPACFLSAAPWHPAAVHQALAGYMAGLRAEVTGRVEETCGNKLSHLRRFRRFCQVKGLTAEHATPAAGPMNAALVTLFLSELAYGAGPEKAICGGTWENYLSTLNTWHVARGLAPVTSWPEVAVKLEGWRRANGARGANVITPKLPFTILMLKLALADLHVRAQAAPPGSGLLFRCRRDAALLTFGFFSLLRKSELAAARLRDLSLAATYCVLRIPKAKADQLAKGHFQYFSYLTASGVDIGAILGTYLAELRAHNLDAADAPLFPHISRNGIARGVFMPRKGEAITDVVRDVLSRMVQAAAAVGIQLVLDPALWASHSLRRGGLNHAIDCDISREARQVLGRWHGEDSQDDYIFWDATRRLAFTAAM